jgi:hypothetical protein
MTHRSRAALVLLALAVFLVWTFMFVHAIRLEERAASHQEFMLDKDGQPVNVVWEIGRGVRPATAEEIESANRED